jgi:hypothetical protein
MARVDPEADDPVGLEELWPTDDPVPGDAISLGPEVEDRRRKVREGRPAGGAGCRIRVVWEVSGALLRSADTDAAVADVAADADGSDAVTADAEVEETRAACT